MNPFKYDCIVGGAYFCPRPELTKAVRVTGNGVLYLKLSCEPVKEFAASTVFIR